MARLEAERRPNRQCYICGSEFGSCSTGAQHVLIAFQVRAGNPEFLHLVDERGALQAQLGRGAFPAADHPSDRFKGVQNQVPF